MENKPKKLITRILEFACVFALSALLIRFAVCCIVEIWPALLILAVVIAGIAIGYRVWRHRSG